jgi:hypothetical protein
LVLCNADNNRHVLPEEITDSVDYEDYKRYCKEYIGTVKMNRQVLVDYTKLVQDFDKLCDELREFCDELSHQSFEIIEMSKAVDRFNDEYLDDLEYLGFSDLKMNADGSVDVSEIFALRSLGDAFMRLLLPGLVEYGYDVEWVDESTLKAVKCK